MRRLGIFIALLLALWMPASAQLTMTGVGGGFGPSGGGSPTIGGGGAITANCSFGANPCVVTTTATVTTGVVAIMAGVLNQGGSNGTITAVSVCGTNLTIDVTRTIANNEHGAAFARGSVTGGTCTISISFSNSGALADIGAAWITMNSLNSGTPDTSCNGFYNGSQGSPYPCTGGLTVTGSGFGVVGFWDNLTALPTNGGSLTVDASAGNGGGRNVGIGHVTATCTAAQCQYNADGFGVTSVYGESFH